MIILRETSQSDSWILNQIGRKRRIKESIAVRELRPSLNGNVVALYLSPIYGLVPSKYSRDDDWFDSGDVINNRDTGMASVVGESDEYEL